MALSQIAMPRSHFSFPKNRRLTRSVEFERVKSEGFWQRGKLLMLGVLQVEDIGPFRAGFVTSRRLGRAAVRNRVRRRLRELVRRHQQEVRASFWIVVTAKSEAARANYYALEDEWLRLAKRASILAA